MLMIAIQILWYTIASLCIFAGIDMMFFRCLNEKEYKKYHWWGFPFSAIVIYYKERVKK